MSGNIYRVTEVVGTSTEGIDDAIRRGVQRAGQTVRNMDWFEMTEVRGHIDGDAVKHFQVTMKIGFRLDD